MKKGLIFAVFVLALLVHFANASFVYIGSNMQTVYEEKDFISGKIDIKLNESCGVNLTSNFEGSANLFDVLNKSGYNKAYCNNSGQVKIDLTNAYFFIPSNVNQSNFTLYIGENKVFSIPIKIAKSEKYKIEPIFANIGIETLFKVVPNTSVVSTSWDFGDLTQKIASNGASAKHSYSAGGIYLVSVEVTSGNSTKTTSSLKLVVGNLNESIRKLIKEKESNFANLTNSLNVFPIWIKNKIMVGLNYALMNSTLNTMKAKYNAAQTERDLQDILTGLLGFDIPSSIYVSDTKTIPVRGFYEDIDTIPLKDLSGKSEETANLENAIAKWNEKYFDPFAEKQTISKITDGNSEEIFIKVKITGQPKTSLSYSVYSFINYPSSDVTLQEQSIKKTQGTSTYVEKVDGLEFLVPYKENLGIFVSPKLDYLEISEIITDAEKPKFQTGWFIFWLLLILIVFFAVYIFLQEWYKKNYESGLFKSRADLYNLINFIYNNRVKGLGDSEIRSKLSSSGWSGEQLRFAFRRIDGKRTGMWEIPIFKGSEKKKVLEEIARRQNLAGIKFIKPQGFGAR